MKDLVLIRGGGDLASGVIQKFHRSGINILVLESATPSFIRRKVCYGLAVYSGEMELEGSVSKYIGSLNENKSPENIENLFVKLQECYKENKIPVLIDENMEIINILQMRKIDSKTQEEYRVSAIVDAIIAKKNLGMNKKLAPITIALGPGFVAGEDLHVVIETMRGHNLGRLIFLGEALANTGVPGLIGGESKLRVIYAPSDGVMKIIKDIGSIVKKDDTIGEVNGIPVKATISGVIRGIIAEGYYVKEKMKIGDIDPREEELENCFTISDKARALGGAALEAYLYFSNKTVSVGEKNGKKFEKN